MFGTNWILNPGIAPLLENINDKKSIKFDDNEKANILQKQFSSIFTQEPEEEIPSVNKRTDIWCPEH